MNRPRSRCAFVHCALAVPFATVAVEFETQDSRLKTQEWWDDKFVKEQSMYTASSERLNLPRSLR